MEDKATQQETLELIQFRINELFEGKDFEKIYPTYQEMLKALFEIQSICQGKGEKNDA